jgi:hypothetical protein
MVDRHTISNINGIINLAQLRRVEQQEGEKGRGDLIGEIMEQECRVASELYGASRLSISLQLPPLG